MDIACSQAYEGGGHQPSASVAMVRPRAEKWCVSINGDVYAALQARCVELGLTVSSVVESFVADLGAEPRELLADGPRVALDVSPALFERIDDHRRRRARVDGVEISRSDALERAILQAIESR